MDARYSSGSEAGFDETSFFVHHLLTCQRESLLSPLVPVSIVHLAGGNDKALRDALCGLLDTVGHALRSSDVLRSWGHYALTRTRIGSGLRQDGALGEADMCSVIGSLERVAIPAGHRRHGRQASRTAYTAIGPRLRAVDGAEPLLTGVEYAASVCRTNLAIADFVRGETERGLCAGSGVRITLDDDSESGGIWRSHHPGAGEEDSGDPLIPAGRGWRDTVAPPENPTNPNEVPEQPHVEAAQFEAPLADEGRAEDELGIQSYLRITDSEVCWQLPLRLAHLIEGRIPLNRLVRDALRRPGTHTFSVRLEFGHPGGMLDASEEVQEVTLDLTAEVGMLSGIRWPIDFVPGLRLYMRWQRDGTALRLSTAELENPVEIDGQRIAHRYDPQVLTRDGAPGSNRDGDSSKGLDIRHLVLRAVRRFGLLTPDGHALLDRAALPRGIYAATPSTRQVSALKRAVDELLAERCLYPATGSRGANGEPHYPVLEGEVRIPLISYVPSPVAVPRSAPGRDGHAQATGTEYFVHGFIRRLPVDWEPTEAQRIAYREYCRHVGKADGWELPHGYTFVTAHSRRR